MFLWTLHGLLVTLEKLLGMGRGQRACGVSFQEGRPACKVPSDTQRGLDGSGVMCWGLHWGRGRGREEDPSFRGTYGVCLIQCSPQNDTRWAFCFHFLGRDSEAPELTCPGPPRVCRGLSAAACCEGEPQGWTGNGRDCPAVQRRELCPVSRGRT